MDKDKTRLVQRRFFISYNPLSFDSAGMMAVNHDAFTLVRYHRNGRLTLTLTAIA
ncbi:MAG: hypothetical protein PHR16_12510 [Methylovulum sp.]|nr:hypothetical protein [Methylovulum sp.]